MKESVWEMTEIDFSVYLNGITKRIIKNLPTTKKPRARWNHSWILLVFQNRNNSNVSQMISQNGKGRYISNFFYKANITQYNDTACKNGKDNWLWSAQSQMIHQQHKSYTEDFGSIMEERMGRFEMSKNQYVGFVIVSSV